MVATLDGARTFGGLDLKTAEALSDRPAALYSETPRGLKEIVRVLAKCLVEAYV